MTSISGSKKTRGKSKSCKLNKAWEIGNHKPLDISFDVTDQHTFHPVGPLAKDFKSLLGVTLRNSVPFTFDTWEKVPAEYKTTIWPQIETYFNMKPHLDGCPTLATNIVTGVSTLCAKLYSSSKYKFKKQHFTNRGGHSYVEALRQKPPSNMSSESWNELLDYYTKEDNIHRAERQANGAYPSHIDSFHEYHTKKGTFTDGGGSVAQRHYENMVALKDSQIDAPKQLTEDEIIDQVLGIRRGHKRGRGQVIRRPNSSSVILAKRSQHGGEHLYTQEEVDALVAEKCAQIEAKCAQTEAKCAQTEAKCSRTKAKLSVIQRGLKAHCDIDLEFEEVVGDEEMHVILED